MFGAWREQPPHPHPGLLRAGQPQFSALWQRGWREQLAPCGPLRRGDSVVGGRPLGQRRPWKSGPRDGAARGELGSSGRQVSVKGSAGTRRGRASSEAVRGCDVLEEEQFLSAARPGQGAGFPLWKVCGYCLGPGRALRQPGREGGGRYRGWEEAAGARQPGRARSRRAGRPRVRVQDSGARPRFPAALRSNSVLSSCSLRRGVLPPAPEPGVGGCSMPARAA